MRFFINFANVMQLAPSSKESLWGKYKRAVQISSEISLHIRGDKIYDLNNIRYPRETDVQRVFRNEIYQPVTKPLFGEAIKGLHRIFSQSNSPYQTSEYTAEYLTTDSFSGFDFNTWLAAVVVPYMIGDPNAVVVIYPTGDGVTDVSVAVNPKVVIFPSKDIYELTDDIARFVTSRENGKATGLLSMSRTDIWQEVLDKEGNSSEVLETRYVHNFGELPAYILGGNYLPREGLFESYFSDAVPFANSFAINYNNLQAITTLYAHPIVVMREIACTNKDCNDGWVYLQDGSKNKCSTCLGKGKLTPFNSPLSFVEVPENSSTAVNDVLGYIEPPIGILDYITKLAESSGYETRKSLLIQNTDAAQSGVAKAIDREREYALLSKVAQNVFGYIGFSVVWAVERYLEPDERKQVAPTVTVPKSFSLESEDELVIEIKELRQASAPEAIVRSLFYDYSAKKYNSDNERLDKLSFLFYYDAFISHLPESIDMLFAAGKIDKLSYYRTLYAPNELDKYALENPNVAIIPENYARIATALDERISAYIPQQLSLFRSEPDESAGEIDEDGEDETQDNTLEDNNNDEDGTSGDGA